jgi:hypothetical protein
MRATIWVQVGALVVVLAVCAGTAQAQPRTTPKQPIEPDPVETGPAMPLPPPVQPVPLLKPVTHDAPKETPASGGHEINMLYEIITVVILLMVCTGGVLAVSVTTHFFLRLTRPTDPVQLALRDPWVRAHQARLPLTIRTPPDPPAPPPPPDSKSQNTSNGRAPAPPTTAATPRSRPRS